MDQQRQFNQEVITHLAKQKEAVGTAFRWVALLMILTLGLLVTAILHLGFGVGA